MNKKGRRVSEKHRKTRQKLKQRIRDRRGGGDKPEAAKDGQ